MKFTRLLAIWLILAMVLVGGCATNKLGDGIELSDEAMFYKAQSEAMKETARPTFEFHVPQGQAAYLPGGTTIIVRAGNNAKIGMYQPWYSGTIGQIITGFVGAYGFNQMNDLGKAGIVGARGNTSTINTAGDGAGVNNAGGNVGNPVTTVSPSTTTTTTTTTTGVEPTGVVPTP